MSNVIDFKPRESEQQTAPTFEHIPIERALLDAGLQEYRAAEFSHYFRQTLGRLGFAEEEALQLFEIIVHCLSDPPTDAKVMAWGATTRDWLNRVYGDDVPAVLQAAQRIASGDRILNALIVAAAIGDHPEAVKVFIDVGLRKGALNV